MWQSAEINLFSLSKNTLNIPTHTRAHAHTHISLKHATCYALTILQCKRLTVSLSQTHPCGASRLLEPAEGTCENEGSCGAHQQERAANRKHSQADERVAEGRWLSCMCFFYIPLLFFVRMYALTHALTHARTYAHPHIRTHTRTHARTHARTRARRTALAFVYVFFPFCERARTHTHLIF